MKRLACIGLGLLLGITLAAQEEEVLRAAQYLSGASTAEEVDAVWVELLEARYGRRLRINDDHLRSGGLLTDYQIASLADYRSRSGDILSWEELALVDGFGPQAVEALRPFLSLASDRLPGAADTVRLKASALVRATLSTLGAKAKASGKHWRAGGAWRGADGTFYGEYTLRNSRLLLGDYKLRFGQGLALWGGFSMESLSTVDAFVRRATGATPVWSYSSSGAQRGAVYEYASRRVQAVGFAALDGSFGAHAAYRWLHGQLGLTAAGLTGNLALSFDGRFNWRGSDLALEGAWKNRSWAGQVAWRKRMGEQMHLALQARAVPSRFSGKKYGEYALAAGTDYQNEKRTHKASLTLDAALLPIPDVAANRLQIRAYASWQWQPPGWSWELRLTERYRNYERPRTSLRMQLGHDGGRWSSAWRAETVFCEKTGFLSYLEGGFKGAQLTAYLRFTGFVIDQWNDRVYCYERDAPGTFSVPAYYGRGGAFSLVGSWKHRFGRICTLKATLRAAWMVRAGRKPAPTLNIQLQCDH